MSFFTKPSQCWSIIDYFLGPENRRLAPCQRGLAAGRHSDHFAVLNAFQQWDRTKQRQGEQAEIDFCNQRMLSMPSLRVTSEAKVSICFLLRPFLS